MRHLRALSLVAVFLPAIISVAYAAEQTKGDSGSFTISGDVAKPGEYPMPERGLRVTGALKLAGGPKETADKVTRLRFTDGQRKEKTFRLCEILSGYRLDPEVVAGDVLTVSSNPLKRTTNIEFQNTPLPTAVETLLKDTGISYTISPGLEQAGVIAKIRNVPLELALRQVLSAAGAGYRLDGSTAVISQQAGMGGFGFGPPQHDPKVVATRSTEPVIGVMQAIPLRYIDPARAMGLLRGLQDVQILSTNNRTLIVKGPREALERAAQLIEQVDRPTSLLRAVRISARVEVTVADKPRQPEPVVAKLSTESVGVEGTEIPLSISSSTEKGEGDANLSLLLVPTLLDGQKTEERAAQEIQGKTISLSGEGTIRFGKMMDSDFTVAVPVAPGQETLVASGSIENPENSVSFKVWALASVETGRIKSPAGVNSSSELGQLRGHYEGVGPFGAPGLPHGDRAVKSK